MYQKAILPALLTWGFCAAGHADDREEIGALVRDYTRFEAAGDMASQAKLMTPDRLWMGPVGRVTDQSLNMEIQQAAMDRDRERHSNAKVFYDARDLIVRVYGGDAAIASFYWYADVILGPEAKDPDPTPSPMMVTLFLTKDAGKWKIAASHNSLLNLSN